MRSCCTALRALPVRALQHGQARARRRLERREFTLKRKLEQLKEAYASGLLTEEEFARKKEEVLKDF